MRKLTYLFRNINLLNVTLLAAVVLLTVYIISPVFDMDIKYNLVAPEKPITAEEEKILPVHISSPSDYTLIAEQNLFHPERKIPPEKKEEKQLLKPEFVLYGTLISDNVKIAYIEDRKSPHSTPGRGKRQTAMRIGQTLSGFTLKEIDFDKVVMARGEEMLVIKVMDSAVKRGATSVQAPPFQAPKPVREPAVQKPPTSPTRRMPYPPQ